MKNKCAWVVSPLGVHPQTFCSKSTGYVMATDAESGQRVRVYHTYCPEHLVAAQKQDDDEDEDESWSEPLLPADVAARMIKQKYPAPPAHGPTIKIKKPRRFNED